MPRLVGVVNIKIFDFFCRNICVVAIFLVILRAESGRYASGHKYVKLLK